MAIPVDPVTIGAAAKYVGQAFGVISGFGQPRVSAADRATLQAQGYRFEPRARLGEVAIDPQGRVITNRATLARQASLARAIAGVPEASLSAADRVAIAAKSPAGKRIIAAGGRILGSGAGQIAIGVTLAELIARGIEGTRTPPAAPPPAPPPPVQTIPNWMNPARYTPPGKQPIPTAAPIPAPPPPPSVAAPPASYEPLTPVTIYTPYIIPSAPSAPTAAPSAPPRSILGMSPAQLAGLAVPTLLALLAGGGSRGRRGVRDPLTVPQTPGGFPGLGLTPGSQPLPSPGGGWGGSSSSSSGTCECPPKRKRGPKKSRSVCYSGRYIERASGLSKTKLRKVPCR